MSEQNKPENNPTTNPVLLVIVLLGFLFSLYFLFAQRQVITEAPRYEVAYSQFKQWIRSNQIASVRISRERAEAELRVANAIGPQGETSQRLFTYLPPDGDPNLLGLIESQPISLTIMPPTSEQGGMAVFWGLVPWLLLLLFYIWFFRRMSRNVSGGLGRGGDIGRFLERPLRKQARIPDISFNDVAGQDSAKREVAELVDYLKQPQRYTALGAEVPRGVLLMGAPGTGKTLLAKALAGEAGVPFFSISGSEFIEVFVGVGASRVRRMFEEAKQRAPSIIFIDELDSVGRVRGTGLGGGNDEREQTLNQILAEMDGFSGHEAVIVLAATNRPDVLDPALLRPGRFDRHVTLELPDLKAREAILAVHCRPLPLDEDVDLARIAAAIPGFSGADIKNLCNEAAMRAVREGRDVVTMRDFDEMRERLLMGTVRTLAIQEEERHRLAVHEAGHTLVAYHLPNADPLYKVTIIPRGRALGMTQQLPGEERHTLPEPYLRDRLAVMMGGRVAEQYLLRSISSGADDDIHQATNLARAMVGRWGMSDSLGPVDLRDSEDHPFLGREMAQPRRFSEASAQAVDEATRALLKEAEARALSLVEKHQAGLRQLISRLEEQETLDEAEIKNCLGDK